MPAADVIVVGGGLSGLAFSHYAASAGQRVLLLEAEPHLGGCLASRQLADGFWCELGAHTCYNSYTTLLELLTATGCLSRLLPRGPARKRFALLDNGRLDTMGPLSVFMRFNLLELALALPRGLRADKLASTTRDYYGGLLGRTNYDRLLGPFLAAVPSQPADDFPAAGPGSLFKKRERRKDVVKSFTLAGGLGVISEALVTRHGLAVRTGAPAAEVRVAPDGFTVQLTSGEQLSAPRGALAVPPSTAGRLLAASAPTVAAALAEVRMAELDSLAVVVPREAVCLPELAFIVPRHDCFFSAVTRDPVPDPGRRAFTFHFRPGLDAAVRERRASELLGLPVGRFLAAFSRHVELPAPRLGHATIVARLDAALRNLPLGLCGNYFAGLAIEDCVRRAESEWQRLDARLTDDEQRPTAHHQPGAAPKLGMPRSSQSS